MIDWLRAHWRNGLKFQIAISLVTLLGVISIAIDQRSGEQVLVLPDSGVVVEAITVYDPVIIGDPLIYNRRICNEGDERVTVGIQRRLVSLSDDGEEHVIPGNATDPIAAHACDDRTRSFDLPEGVSPGEWVLRLVFSVTLSGPYDSADSDVFTISGSDEGGQ